MTPQKYLSKVRYQIQYQYQIKLEMSNNRIKTNENCTFKKHASRYWLNFMQKLLKSVNEYFSISKIKNKLSFIMNV